MLNSEKPVVLVIDDNEPTCTLLTALLHKEFVVETAGDGIEAVEKLRTKSYAAIILDLLMPHLDGYGVLDFLQTHNADALRRVIVVSAALRETDKERLRDYSVCSVIRKPFEVEVLLNAVKQCVAPVQSHGNIISNGVILLLADLLRHKLL